MKGAFRPLAPGSAHAFRSDLGGGLPAGQPAPLRRVPQPASRCARPGRAQIFSLRRGLCRGCRLRRRCPVWARGENILPARAGRWCGPRPLRRLAPDRREAPPPGQSSSLRKDSPDDILMPPLAPLGARNATLADLAALLRDQQARKVDIVAPAAAIRARRRRGWSSTAPSPVLGPDGVTMTAGTYTPTEVCDQGLADKLGIPGRVPAAAARAASRACTTRTSTAGWTATTGRFLIRCLRPARGPARGGAGVPVRRLQDDRQPRRAARRPRRRPPGRGPGRGRRV